jgi:hypothetical protein
MKTEYYKALSNVLYIVAIVTPLIFLYEAYLMYQYRDLGFMIVLQNPDKTLSPLFEPWVLFVVFAVIWIKAIVIWFLANIKTTGE